MEFKRVKEMLKGALFIGFTAIVLSCQAAVHVDQPLVDGIKNIKPDVQQELVAKELVSLIENYNYKHIKIGDSISSIILDNFIKKLDGSRNYFLASDIKSFEKFRTTLDDDFRRGDLSAPFYIFNVYMKRYSDFVNYSLNQVKQPVNFTSNETYTYDREKMPWISTQTGLNDLWKRRVRYDLVNLKIAGTSSEKNIETITKRYENVKSQNEKINNQDVFQVVMDAFTNAIDPHTSYFNPRNAEVFNEDMARSFDGIGAVLRLENEVIIVDKIVPGGPAFKTKLLNAGDRIVAVGQGNSGDFDDIIGWRIDNSVKKIKGPRGTTVRLKVIPAGQELSSKPVTITLVREKIVREDESAKKSVETVESDGKTFKIGIIAVPAFYADWKAMNDGDKNYKSTTRDVRILIDSLKNFDKVDAIVMDLRANGGGSLNEAIDLTGLFIDRGPVVQVKGLRGEIEVSEDKDPGLAWDGPFGVMVDRLSASASEIFAGAIQDYGRGIIMGTQTYGKGTVQSVIDLSKILNPSIIQRLVALVSKNNSTKIVGSEDPNTPELGQVSLTMGKFYRISGGSTQHKGVVPDISFPSVYPLDKIGEDTEPSALPYDMVKKTNYQVYSNLSSIKPMLIKKHEERMENSLDFKFLEQDIADMKKRSNETSVSLNEVKLKAERDALETKNLARVNALRAAKNLPPVKKGDKISKQDSQDFIQKESLRIMADLLHSKATNM